MYSSNQNYYDNSRLSETAMPPSAPPPPVSHEYNHLPVAGIPVGYSSNSTSTPATWSTGLCDCSSDVSNCCLTCWCPCITFGQIADIVDKGSKSRGASVAFYAVIAFVAGCTCCYSAIYRTKLRRQYNLPETPCGDCLVHCCCEPCAMCQEHRELRHRGFDMSLGWQGNMEKQNGGVAMAPMPHGGMSR